MKDTFTDEEYSPIDLPIVVCHSNAGYYIGQHEPSGCPFSRLSGYYPEEEDARFDLYDACWIGGRSENASLEAELVSTGILSRFGDFTYSLNKK